MGIDFHTVNFLNHISLKQKSFGRTLTLGRQNLCVSGAMPGVYCESFLINNYNATSVDSLDISDFEGATIILDLNKRVPKNYFAAFDTIIDAGTLEHIFNIKQAFENIVSMLKNGGQVIHISPTNGFSGHGFYQFSLDLFKSIYSKESGFIHHEVFVAEVNNERSWYKVRFPTENLRFNVYGVGPMYMMSHAVKAFQGNAPNVQQSDYQFHWSDQSADIAIKENELIKEWDCRPKTLLDNILRKCNLISLSRINNLQASNPFLERLSIKDIDLKLRTS